MSSTNSETISVADIIKQGIQDLFAQVRPRVHETPSSSDVDIAQKLRLELDVDVQVYELMTGYIQNSVSACRTRRNGLASVHNLTRDIVSMIFDSLLSPSLQYYDQPNSLRLVCKTWMEHIDSLPHYWIYVWSHLSTDVINRILRRSQGATLAISYNPASRQDSERLVEVLRKLAASDWPIRSLQLGTKWMRLTEYEITLIKTFLESPSPHIRTLEISALRHENVIQVVIDNLFAGEAPNLKTLDLQNVTLRWETLALPHLKTLAIGNHTGHRDRWLTVQKFLAVLRGCPGLELVKLANVPFFHPNPVILAPTAHKRVVMKHLREFYLQSIHPQVADDLLRRVALPACSNLDVGSQETFVTPALVSQLLEGVMEMMPAPTVTVRTGDTSLVEVKGAHWTVCAVEEPEWDASPHAFRRLLIESLPMVVRNAVSAYDMAPDQLLPPIRNMLLPILDEAFPQLSQLSMLAEADFELDLLSAPQGGHWLFPNLHTLGLEGDALVAGELSAVVGVAQARHLAHEANGGAVVELSTFRTSLRRVEVLRGAAKAVFEQMEEVFAQVEFDERPVDPDDGPTDGDTHIVFVYIRDPDEAYPGLGTILVEVE